MHSQSIVGLLPAGAEARVRPVADLGSVRSGDLVAPVVHMGSISGVPNQLSLTFNKKCQLFIQDTERDLKLKDFFFSSILHICINFLY